MNPDAILYRKISRVQENDIKLLMAEMTPKLKWSEDDMIMDVGCGLGGTTREVLLPRCSKFRKVVAVDSCPEMVEYGRRRFSSSSIDYRVADFQERETLSMKWQERFTKVFSFHYLHWVPDQLKALNNMYHLLAPGGDLVLLFVTWTDIWETINNIMCKKQWKEYVKDICPQIPKSQYMSSEERVSMYQNMLIDIGFDIETCVEIKASFIYMNDDDCKDVLDSLCPNSTLMTTEKRESFINCCMRDLKRRKEKNILHHHELYYHKMIIHVKKILI